VDTRTFGVEWIARIFFGRRVDVEKITLPWVERGQRSG
jgi:hypothetical protein